MTICINSSDPMRFDEYGKDGYTACCEDHLHLIGTENYFSSKADHSQLSK